MVRLPLAIVYLTKNDVKTDNFRLLLSMSSKPALWYTDSVKKQREGLVMPSIYVKDDVRLRAEEGIRYDFLAPDGSESREAAAVIAARNLEFNKGIPSSQDYLDMKLAVEV